MIAFLKLHACMTLDYRIKDKEGIVPGNTFR